MRQMRVRVMCVALLVAGCGSDDAASDTTAAAAPTTAAPATTAAPTTPATTAAPATTETTAAPTTTAAPAAAAAPLVPEAVCVTAEDAVYFAYENAGNEPVVVPDGDGNALTGGMADDNPLHTTLFAPGRVDPAFWAYLDPERKTTLTWTLVGPDDVERTAVADDSLPLCPDGYPDDAVDDPRTPTLVIAGQELSADGTSAEVQLELTGVPETSVCNPAFEPETALVSIGDGTALPTGYEPTTTAVVGPFAPATSGDGMIARAFLYPLVVDQCTAAGVTVRSWSAADALQALTFVSSAPAVCARLDGAGELSITLYDSCEGLPTTGGSSIRPG